MQFIQILRLPILGKIVRFEIFQILTHMFFQQSSNTRVGDRCSLDLTPTGSNLPTQTAGRGHELRHDRQHSLVACPARAT